MYYLFDYADVISLPQDQECFRQMSQFLTMKLDEFHEAYWKFRKPYDLGQPGNEYWPLVAGRKLSENELSTLIDLDCQGWGRINPKSLEYVTGLKKKNLRTGILSNLPIELVHFLRGKRTFLPLFDDVFFSAEIKKVKPEKNAYEHVLDSIKLPAGEVIFHDDKLENLETASALGMKVFHVTQESIEELRHS